jgi:hypothetical protein
MTRVVIRSGSCGFTATVTAKRGPDRKVHITLDSDCEMVRRMRDDVRELEMTAALTGFANNPVYRSAAKHLKHVACPVPSGILKVIEVETGLNVPRDATIVFASDPPA